MCVWPPVCVQWDCFVNSVSDHEHVCECICELVHVFACMRESAWLCSTSFHMMWDAVSLLHVHVYSICMYISAVLILWKCMSLYVCWSTQDVLCIVHRLGLLLLWLETSMDHSKNSLVLIATTCGAWEMEQGKIVMKNESMSLRKNWKLQSALFVEPLVKMRVSKGFTGSY